MIWSSKLKNIEIILKSGEKIREIFMFQNNIHFCKENWFWSQNKGHFVSKESECWIMHFVTNNNKLYQNLLWNRAKIKPFKFGTKIVNRNSFKIDYEAKYLTLTGYVTIKLRTKSIDLIAYHLDWLLPKGLEFFQKTKKNNPFKNVCGIWSRGNVYFSESHGTGY